MQPDLTYFDLLFGDWLEYKTGVHYHGQRFAGPGGTYCKNLRMRPDLQNKHFYVIHSTFPEEPPKNPYEADGRTPLVSEPLKRALPLLRAELKALGLEAQVTREVLNIDRVADDPRFAEMPDMRQLSYAFDPFPDHLAVDLVSFDTNLPSFRPAIDRMWQDEAFQQFVAHRNSAAHRHPFTGEPLVKDKSVEQDAEYIRNLKRHMQLWYQNAHREGSQPLVNEKMGKAFLATYGLRPGIIIKTDQRSDAADGISEPDLQMMHMIEAWIR